MFKYLKLYIKKEKGLLVGLILSLTILLTWLILMKWEEKVWFGYEFGIISSSLAIGYVVSYIFNFIVVFIPRQKTKENTSEYLQRRLSFLCIEAARTANGLIINSKVKNLTFPLNEDELIRIFENLDPVVSHCSTNLMKRKYNWFEYLKYVVVKQAEDYINEVFTILPHLDIELVKILNSIKDSELFNAAHREIIPQKQDLINARDGRIPRRLGEYFKLISQIDKYLDLNFSYENKYQKERKKEMYGA
ncbi:MAG: hypothetical protein A2W91_06680 [Bacteroidetes bacterium GWF2_38_335]|nr:MAG: hypothetical protein A2W91_06680 [Bacteroidetes bacterium GWF2_38_335]OFY77716.1 MAG: hypothetical protein A2281_18195 [Bacteroidetes bacterium RIFOXYA12_FULL_38_20]HBS89053.1 hypothetical protein [Bacteroidales bacterium]